MCCSFFSTLIIKTGCQITHFSPTFFNVNFQTYSQTERLLQRAPQHVPTIQTLPLTFRNCCIVYMSIIHPSLPLTHPFDFLIMSTLAITFSVHPENPECYSHLKIFNLVTSSKFLLLHKVTWSQVLGMKTWASVKSYYFDYSTYQSQLVLGYFLDSVCFPM